MATVFPYPPTASEVIMNPIKVKIKKLDHLVINNVHNNLLSYAIYNQLEFGSYHILSIDCIKYPQLEVTIGVIKGKK